MEAREELGWYHPSVQPLLDLHPDKALQRLQQVTALPISLPGHQTSQQDAIRAAAAKGLGNVAAATGDPRTIPPLIAYLKSAIATMETSEDINFPVLTEVVWSVGKLRDENAIAPMAELQKKIWLIYDNSPEMASLREAANWSYKQLDLDGHIS